ncbi:hypothetical protein ONS95_008918 [Cadophora gregata]|uniref:uncharacterized protein n=1 Tax=Cadophora gregata TaxID=51156 RepID=UPI0026DA8838|nr:uncharacterized protein ONS95_008918 [Cadophora gregata]KAK0123928.1 hypothetical protein ONS95_008918 [Cadophora gregata]KAK0130267.1 hypothetical protein ONS96_000790 [Cadophora gregata f. sp. sojae]
MGKTDIISGAAEIVKTILEALQRKNDEDHAKERDFTQSTVQNLRVKYPYYNVMVIHTKHQRNFVDEAHNHLELPISNKRTQGYEVYVFESGSFTLQGNSGFENWAFGGSFNRDGNNVTFQKIPAPQSFPPVQAPPPPAILPPKPTRTHADGMYLVNCQRGNEYSSGVAYYKNLHDGGNTGRKPDDYIDVVKGRNVNWEKPGSVSFKNGTKFRWGIIADAQSKADTTRVGFADNGYGVYALYKDNKNVLYNIDGWNCHAIYWGY